MVNSEDLGDYYRIKADNRDLNYNTYFTVGKTSISEQKDYHSHNTKKLDIKSIKKLILKLDYVQEQLAEFKKEQLMMIEGLS